MSRCKHLRHPLHPSFVASVASLNLVAPRTRPICLQTQQIQANSLPNRAQTLPCDGPHVTQRFLSPFSPSAGLKMRAISLRKNGLFAKSISSLFPKFYPAGIQNVPCKGLNLMYKPLFRNILQQNSMQLIANKDRGPRNVNFRSVFAGANLICWHSTFMSANLDTGLGCSLESTCRIVSCHNVKLLLARNLASRRHLLWHRRHLSENGNARF